MLLHIVVFLTIPLVISTKDPAICANACQNVLSYVLFDESPDDYYTLTCTEPLPVKSTFLCMRYYCSEVEITDGLASLDNTCQTYGAVELLPWSIIRNISNEELLAWPNIEIVDLQGEISYDTPVFVSEPLFDVSLRTMVFILIYSSLRLLTFGIRWPGTTVYIHVRTTGDYMLCNRICYYS